jgi:DNA-binding XRE family transcriptional regulator
VTKIAPRGGAYDRKDAMGDDTVTIPRVEYVRLIEIAQDAADAEEARRLVAAIERGEEIMIPAADVTRIPDGESPLRVFRELRGLNISQLAEKSGVNRVQIHDIEAGRRKGGVETLKRLAEPLGLIIGDLV